MSDLHVGGKWIYSDNNEWLVCVSQEIPTVVGEMAGITVARGKGPQGWTLGSLLVSRKCFKAVTSFEDKDQRGIFPWNKQIVSQLF